MLRIIHTVGGDKETQIWKETLCVSQLLLQAKASSLNVLLTTAHRDQMYLHTHTYLYPTCVPDSFGIAPKYSTSLALRELFHPAVMQRAGSKFIIMLAKQLGKA